jgi:hypothetical protein
MNRDETATALLAAILRNGQRSLPDVGENVKLAVEYADALALELKPKKKPKD